jgi:cytochrome oxidase assembly protein ShyY1
VVPLTYLKKLALVLAIVGASMTCFGLGQWQMARYEERLTRNAQLQEQRVATPQPVTEVLSTTKELASGNEWTYVTATGSYVPEKTVLVRYRPHNNEPGVEVVTPLKLISGEYLIVDRGWLPVSGVSNPKTLVPAPPVGRTTLTGWVRVNGSGASVELHDGMVRAISSAALADDLQLSPILEGFLMLNTEAPPAQVPLTQPELPKPTTGPHLYYAWQWRFFGTLILVGGAFGMLAHRRSKPLQTAQ